MLLFEPDLGKMTRCSTVSVSSRHSEKWLLVITMTVSTNGSITTVWVWQSLPRESGSVLHAPRDERVIRRSVNRYNSGV